jgi:DNA-binding NtrC family response regulator
MAWHLLLVEDEESVREAFALRLGSHGYLVQTAGSGEEALALLRSFEPDILVLDLVMPNLSGLDVLARVKQTSPNLLVILLTARGTVKDAVEATKLGAFDFVAKSIDMEDLQHALSRATEFLTLQRQVRLQSGQDAARYALDRIIAKSPVTQSFLGQVRELAKNDRVTVLLQGETGTGKQYMGRVIHFNGARAAKACIEVDCPSIPRDLFESELFGHEKGSFTGAAGRKSGLIEMAEGGTVLFDEIGDLPLPLQAKLLRVIEERTLRRVGGSATIPVDVRFMAATNRNLKEAVAKGEFREDLYFRLNVVTLTVPALRDRRDDIIPVGCGAQETGSRVGRERASPVEPVPLSRQRPRAEQPDRTRGPLLRGRDAGGVQLPFRSSRPGPHGRRRIRRTGRRRPSGPRGRHPLVSAGRTIPGRSGRPHHHRRPPTHRRQQNPRRQTPRHHPLDARPAQKATQLSPSERRFGLTV